MADKRTSRTEQREQTRQRIVDAAVDAFAAGGFEGTSTRDIAERAGVTQGLVTYHFTSKDELWRAAVDHIFAGLEAALPARDEPDADGQAPPDGRSARLAIRAYVSFSARHPELFQLMVDAGRHDDERMRWIVDRHLQGRFAEVSRLAGERGADAAHLYYALVGAASLVSAVAPECRALTGVDPLTEQAIGRHADVVATLFAP